jgi:hypothetical protein
VVELKLRPVGNAGATLYVNEPVPPEPMTGVNAVAARFCVNVVEATACVAVTAVFTVRLKVAVAVAPFVSVTVTVYVPATLAAVGVPVIAPVVELKLSPAGSAGATLYVNEPVPPEPVTGANAVAARFCVNAVEATACVAVTAAFTVRLKVAVAVAPWESVTVTVYVLAALAAVGVPVTAPVVELKLSPAGNAGATL